MDDFILNKKKRESIYIITLSDGTIVYQDDDRPEVTPNSAWLRLKDKVRAEKLKIVDIKLHFRSRTVEVYSSKDLEECEGIFFSKQMLGSVSLKPSIYKPFVNIKYYIFGRVIGTKIYTIKFNVPAMILDTTEPYEIRELYHEINDWSENIIWNDYDREETYISTRNSELNL